MKKYVITGGTCTGKTTVINLLKNMGHPTVPETARMVIEKELKNDSDILPWKNLYLFEEEMIKLQIELEKEIKEDSFLDRGALDSYAFCRIANISIPTVLTENIFKYEKVFFLERLDFYKNDHLRVENEELSKKVEKELINVYQEFGYDLIFVPKMSPKERVHFILKQI